MPTALLSSSCEHEMIVVSVLAADAWAGNGDFDL